MKTRKLTVNALFFAIILLLAVVPNVGFVQIGSISITIMHVPVIIAGIILGLKSSIFAGVVFGLGSLYVALTRASGPIDLLFVNPLVSVLPRIIFGASIALFYSLYRRLIKSDAAAIIATTISASIVHTFCVMTAIFLAILTKGDANLNSLISAGFMPFIISIFTANTLVEVLVGVVIVPPAVLALKKVM